MHARVYDIIKTKCWCIAFSEIVLTCWELSKIPCTIGMVMFETCVYAYRATVVYKISKQI